MLEKRGCGGGGGVCSLLLHVVLEWLQAQCESALSRLLMRLI